jgi:predicted membrane channel-forming protein YqfA (hemolysin III family)
VLFDGGFSFSNFLVDVLAIFVFVLWFWLIITVFADLFRRHDISGWSKALWVIVLILIPYLGVFAYMIFQARGMAERNAQYAEQARDDLRRVVGLSVADELQKLDGLKRSGSISEDEFRHLRARLVH